MAERESSNTAERVAELRAAHQLVDGEPKILRDAAVLRLLGERRLEEIRANPAVLNTPWLLALRSHVLVRSRFAEDRLAEAWARGVKQYVLLGAGFDTFAYRQAEWAQGLQIFEVDHPASQRAKREKLAGAGIAIPSNLEFVPIDFEHESLQEGLAGSRLDFHTPAFFSCLGVLVYLTEASVEALFRTVASFPVGSEVVFSFSVPDSTLNPHEIARRAALAAVVQNMGEPWRTFLDPGLLAQKLRDFGFSPVTFLDPAEAERKYFQGRTDGLRPPRRERIASAMVGQR